jgi:hypothetical protein
MWFEGSFIMAFLNSGYRTNQSENFDPIDADEYETETQAAHGKFIALVVLAVIAAASVATLFAVIA